MTTKILRAVATGLLMAVGLGAVAWADEDKSRLERASENCKAMIKDTFALKEDTDLEIANTNRRSRDRTFMTVVVDVPGAGERQIRCQVRERGDGIQRLRVFDEDAGRYAPYNENSGWAHVDELAKRAQRAAAAEARAEEQAAAQAAALGEVPETGETEEGAAEGDGATAEGDADAGTAEEGDAETADGAEAADGDDEATEEETAEAEEEKVPSGPVFKRVK